MLTREEIDVMFEEGIDQLYRAIYNYQKEGYYTECISALDTLGGMLLQDKMEIRRRLAVSNG